MLVSFFIVFPLLADMLLLVVVVQLQNLAQLADFKVLPDNCVYHFVHSVCDEMVDPGSHNRSDSLKKCLLF